MSTIEIRDLTKNYGKTTALDNVSVTFKETASTVCSAETAQENPPCSTLFRAGLLPTRARSSSTE